jgi:hypothetical protein
VLVVIGMIALASPATALDVEEWDQKQIASLATQLESVVNKLYESARVDTWEPMTRKNVIYLIVQDLKTLKRLTERLARQLNEGEGREATSALFERIGRVVRDIRAKRGMAPILEDSEDEIDEARGQLNALAAFYGQQPLPPVATPPATK